MAPRHGTEPCGHRKSHTWLESWKGIPETWERDRLMQRCGLEPGRAGTPETDQWWECRPPLPLNTGMVRPSLAWAGREGDREGLGETQRLPFLSWLPHQTWGHGAEPEPPKFRPRSA